MTYNETKYDLEQFKAMLMDNEEFFNEIKSKIVNKQKEVKVDEPVESEI